METENLSPVDAGSPPIADGVRPESSTVNPTAEAPTGAAEMAVPPLEPKPSYVKLAMRNMVRKRGKSLQHFFLTAMALLGLLVGLSYLTR